MRGIEAPRARAVVAALVAALLLIGVAGCGGSSDGGSDGASGASSDDTSGGGTDAGGDSEAASDLPDPCELVPIDTASEILGGPSAEPDGRSSDVGTSSRACSWQTQESVDDPSLDNAGHVLTLTVIAPPGEMSMDEFYGASEEAADEQADVDGCEQAYWMGGTLSALQDGVYLTGSAGLADNSPDAKAATTALLEAACASLS